MNIKFVLGYNSGDEVRRLFEEYEEVLLTGDPTVRDYLKVQSYEQEVFKLQDIYAFPEGRFYLVYKNDELAGCIGIKKIDLYTCELKRLFVRSDQRGNNIGDMLIKKAIEDAKEIGYKCIVLDTLPFLKSAIHLYYKNDFYEIDSYNNNPMESLLYFKLDL